MSSANNSNPDLGQMLQVAVDNSWALPWGFYADVATAAGVSRPHVAGVLTGNRNYSSVGKDSVLAKIATALGWTDAQVVAYIQQVKDSKRS